MVKILTESNKRAAAVLSDMNSPLGEGVGGVLEVIDAIEVLQGKESRLRDLALLIAGKIISLAKKVSPETGASEAQKLLRDGSALGKFREMIAAQGGSLDLFDPEYRSGILSHVAGRVVSPKGGWIKWMDCVRIGRIAREFEEWGGEGMFVYPKVGSRVEKGAELVTLYGDSPVSEEILAALGECFRITEEETAPNPLVYEIVE